MRLLTIIITIVLGSLLMDSSCTNKQLKQELQDCHTIVSTMNDLNARLLVDKEVAVSTAETHQINHQAALSKIAKLQGIVDSKPKSITRYVQKLQIDTVIQNKIDTQYVEVLNTGDSELCCEALKNINNQGISAEFIHYPWVEIYTTARLQDSYYNLNINDDLIFSTTLEKYGPLKLKKKYQTTAYSQNPYISHATVQGFELKPKQPKFSLGLQLGYGVSTDFKPQPHLGLGLQYNLINF